MLTGYIYRRLPDGSPLTTREGVAIGAPISDIEFVGGGYSGDFDRSWGADIWFADDRLGGELTHDITHPDSRVPTITAGATGNPASIVVC